MNNDAYARLSPPAKSKNERAFGRVFSSEERKRLLIDTAARVFEARGYHGTSMNDVANELGITKAALYHYVDSKEQLLYEIHDAFVSAIVSEAEDFIAAHSDARDQLQFLTRNIFRNVSDYHPYVRVFFEDIGGLGVEWADRIREKRARYLEILVKCLSTGVEQGVFKMPVTPNLAAWFFLGACNWTYQWMRADGAIPPQQLADSWFEMVLKAFSPDVPVPALSSGTDASSPEKPGRSTRRRRQSSR